MHQSASALGSGTYGDVRRAELPLGPQAPYQRVAIKTMRLPQCQSKDEIQDEIHKTQREMELQAMFSNHEQEHPHLTPLLFDHEWQIGPDPQNTFFALVMRKTHASPRTEKEG